MTSKNISPWSEKYRPKSLDDIVQQHEVVSLLKNTIQTNDLPHLIFYGPPGTGKTSTALALCHTLFKGSDIKKKVLELNASDERGIDSIRKHVKEFASIAVPEGGLPFKVIILDEADSMTKDAQGALRRIIEVHSNTTRFIIICNYVSKIIDPIMSRCAKFRFKSLDKQNVIDRMKFVMSSENIKVDNDDVFETLYNVSNGDLRKALTYAQTSSATGSISSDIILNCAGIPTDKFVESFFLQCLKSSSNSLRDRILDVVYSGYDLGIVLQMLIKIVIESDFEEDKKPFVLSKIAEVESNICNRADPLLQFWALATYIMKINK